MASRSYCGNQKPVRALVVKHVEVVEPEIVQLFGQLPVALDRAQQLRFQQIVGHHLLRSVQQQDLAPDIGGRGSKSCCR